MTDSERSKRVTVAGLFWATIVVCATGVAVATALGWLGSLWWPFDLFNHGRFYAWVAGVPLIIACAAGRWWRLLVLSAVPFVLHSVAVAPLYSAAPAPAADARELAVLHYNVNTANTNRAGIVQFIEKSGADVVFLFEVSPSWMADVVRIAPPYRLVISRPQRDNFGIAMLARIPVEDAEVVTYTDWGIPTIEATVKWDGRTVLLIGAHPVPPIGIDYATHRDDQLAAMAERIRGRRGDTLVVGDFNATPWSRPFRSFVETADLQLLPFGYSPTWGSAFVWLPIDHSLCTLDWTATTRTIGERLGSDHNPVLVKYARANAPR